jgi:hypothetical protein
MKSYDVTSWDEMRELMSPQGIQKARAFVKLVLNLLEHCTCHWDEVQCQVSAEPTDPRIAQARIALRYENSKRSFVSHFVATSYVVERYPEVIPRYVRQTACELAKNLTSSKNF